MRKTDRKMDLRLSAPGQKFPISRDLIDGKKVRNLIIACLAAATDSALRWQAPVAAESKYGGGGGGAVEAKEWKLDVNELTGSQV